MKHCAMRRLDRYINVQQDAQRPIALNLVPHAGLSTVMQQALCPNDKSPLPSIKAATNSPTGMHHVMIMHI